MKVACIGNMNNNFFSLVRYLRDEGIEADLLLSNTELSQFPPSADTFDLEYQRFTRSLSWGDHFQFLNVRKDTIERDVEEYDVLIGCGQVPAFLNKIGRPLDIFVPYGTDLVYFPFLQIVNPVHQVPFLLFSRAQRKGIQRCRYVNMDVTNPEWEETLARIGGNATRLRCGFPMLYTPLYNPKSVACYYERSHWYHEFKRIRERHSLVIFHHARLQWKEKIDDVMRKDNDKIIIGFAEFAKGNEDVNPCLILIEYGKDVDATRLLVKELGIEQFVRWFPRMARKDLMIGLSLSDISASGEFFKSYLSFGTLYESLAMAKPIMHFREDDYYRDDYPELYPMINIRSPEDVTAALVEWVADPIRYREMGEQGLGWFQKYAIEKPLAAYLEIIQEGR